MIIDLWINTEPKMRKEPSFLQMQINTFDQFKELVYNKLEFEHYDILEIHSKYPDALLMQIIRELEIVWPENLNEENVLLDIVQVEKRSYKSIQDTKREILQISS